MKIGIFTFHRATNYGAVLQAYALVSYLNSIGHDAKIIDYKPKGMANLFASLNVPGLFMKLKRIAINILMLPSLKNRKQKRDMFWKYIESVLPMTSKVNTSDDLPVMDAYIVGSDQVWSVCFTGGLDNFYWGQFQRKGAKMISYAGSAAENMEESFYNNNNSDMLETFDFISVREEELRKYLQEKLPHKEIIRVLDPTLMAGVDYFEELIKGEKNHLKPYILIYQVIRSKNDLIQKYAKELSIIRGWNIVEIRNSRLHISSNGKISVLQGMINPTLYVSLFKYAKYVITTSFHGTAFSILFNKPFSVISVNTKVDSRARDMLIQLNLEKRLVSLPATIPSMDIDWNRINNKLVELRTPSRNFLQKSLS